MHDREHRATPDAQVFAFPWNPCSPPRGIIVHDRVEYAEAKAAASLAPLRGAGLAHSRQVHIVPASEVDRSLHGLIGAHLADPTTIGRHLGLRMSTLDRGCVTDNEHRARRLTAFYLARNDLLGRLDCLSRPPFAILAGIAAQVALRGHHLHKVEHTVSR